MDLSKPFNNHRGTIWEGSTATRDTTGTTPVAESNVH